MNEIVASNRDKIADIWQKIEDDIEYYIDHSVFNSDNVVDENTVSIVMTTHQRIPQTLFTLDSIQKSEHKNVQVVIVDDSLSCYMEDSHFQKYPFRIDYVKIKTDKRNWSNPCINYNIGFKFIKGTMLIIQNAEVCHVGDVVSYVKNRCVENSYLVFDVINSKSFQINNKLYKQMAGNDPVNVAKNLRYSKDYGWYQHPVHRNGNFHFLTAIHMNDFTKLNFGFDIDFALGRWYDDDELVYRITNVLKLTIHNVNFDKEQVMGIHQFHETVMLNVSKKEYQDTINLNKYILRAKKAYHKKTGQWLFIHDSPDNLHLLT